MNVLDLILLVPIVWYAYRGFTRGLIMSVTSLVALVAGIYFSIHFSGWVAAWIRANLEWDSQYMNIISFAATFVLVVMIINLIGKLFDKVADMAALGFLNRLTGLLLGLVKATLLLGIALFLINSIDVDQKLITDKMRSGSHLYKPLSSVVPGLWPKVKHWVPGQSDQQKEKSVGVEV